ncbi:hypothetical protein L218DRAFT_744662 [Marasmius fiardii PR-910]|nr:hypothetical protein L218DRAFT_744662 [Marasmius fiardii PR-910]
MPDPPIDNVNTLVWAPLQPPNVHSSPAIAHIVSSLQSLTNLHLIKTRFADIRQFQWFLSNCSPITFLEIHRVALDDSGPGQAEADPGINYDLTDLEELRMNSASSTDWVVHHLLSRSTPTALTSLSIESPSTLSSHTFSRLLSIVAPSLKRLAIGAITVPRSDLMMIEGVDSFPRVMPQMENITIVLPFLNARLGDLFDWCSTFIEILPSANALSYITILLDIGNGTRLRQVVNDFQDGGAQFFQLLLGKIPGSFPRVKEIVVHLILNREERPTPEQIQDAESIFKVSSNEDTRVRVQWEVVVDPGRFRQHLPDGMSPAVALALRCRSPEALDCYDSVP